MPVIVDVNGSAQFGDPQRGSPSRSRSHQSKAKKRCRTATPWPIALCSGPLVGFLNQAVLTASEEEREHILSTPSRLIYSTYSSLPFRSFGRCGLEGWSDCSASLEVGVGLAESLRKGRSILTHNGFHVVVLSAGVLVFVCAGLVTFAERNTRGANIHDFGPGLWSLRF